jgi:hypothetical protein
MVTVVSDILSIHFVGKNERYALAKNSLAKMNAIRTRWEMVFTSIGQN